MTDNQHSFDLHNVLHNNKRSWCYISHVLTHIAAISANVRLSVLAIKDTDAL